jgi:hypothetical protein
MRYQTIWLRNGRAYLPAIGCPPSGMFFEVDPVTSFELTPVVLERELKAAIDREPVRLPERSRAGGSWPKQSVVQQAAMFKSWKTFAKAALRIALVETESAWVVAVGEGESPEDVESVTLSRDASLGELAGTVWEIINRRTIWRR